jgi:hypothetical protein
MAQAPLSLEKIHVHPLHTRYDFLVSALLLAVFGLFSFAYAAGASDLVPSNVISLTNEARAEKGLAPLTENRALDAAAEAKARDMLAHNYFAHTSPQGVAPWHWIKNAGYAYQAAGENLAINFMTSEDQQAAWMQSKTHRDNILNREYQEMGVAVIRGTIEGREALVTVALFGRPLAAAGEGTLPSAVKGAETVAQESALVMKSMPLFTWDIDWMRVIETFAVLLLGLSVVAPAGVFLHQSFTGLVFLKKGSVALP